MLTTGDSNPLLAVEVYQTGVECPKVVESVQLIFRATQPVGTPITDETEWVLN